MSKRNFALIGFVAMAMMSANNAYSGWFKFSDRWNSRFVTDDPKGSDAKNNTTNTSSGKTIQEDGTSSPAPAESADVQAFGAGEMNCRDSVVKIRTSDDGSASLSSVSIAEVKHTATTSASCVSFSPKLYVAGLAVDKGSVSLKCNNGQLRVIASSCEGTPPPPPSTDPGTTPSTPANPGTTPAANPNGCAIGYGALTSNCGCCSDGATTYSKTRSTGGGKGGNMCSRTNTQFRSCTNGKYFIINTGTCSSVKPTAC